MRTVFQTSIFGSNIELIEAIGSFTVIHDKSISSGLNHVQAAHILGLCIMDALTNKPPLHLVIGGKHE